MGLAYERSWNGDLTPHSPAFDEERVRGHTTIGPQRDDLAVTLDGRDTRRQASQGEQRSLALATATGRAPTGPERRGVDPLLLLDDVFSELDPMRAERLLHLLPGARR